MTKVFIPSLSGDSDSILLLTALEERGHKVVRWVGDNYPSIDISTFFISNAEPVHGYAKGPELELLTEDIDVVWLRRPRWPVMPREIHPDDVNTAEQECRQYIRSFYQASWLTAFWVNSLDGRRKANSKILQLREAAFLGFKIPNTIISNEPIQIKRFIYENSGEVVVKALIGGEWKEDGGKRFCYTSSIEIGQLPSDTIIQACPCIYQRKVNKISEVRAVFFGAEAVAIELDSQSSTSANLDWRVNPYTFSSKIIQIPDRIYSLCRKIMSRLGIVHGSFDFAIDLTGDWVFFEVNEAGQFFWLEDFVPELPMLELATQFFSSPSWDFRMKKNATPLKMSKVLESSRFIELRDADLKNLTSGESTAIV